MPKKSILAPERLPLWIVVSIALGAIAFAQSALSLRTTNDALDRIDALEEARQKGAAEAQPPTDVASDAKIIDLENQVDHLERRLNRMERVAHGERIEPAKIYTKVVYSNVQHIDRIYRSMLGPTDITSIALEEGEPHLLWLLGYKTTVVGADDEKPLSQEFMCHVNLDVVDASRLRRSVHLRQKGDRLFTLSQGQQDVSLPEGIGIPIMSDEDLNVVMQVLNLNIENADIDVRQRVEIRYVHDEDVFDDIKPVFVVGIQGLKALSDARYPGMTNDEAIPEKHGSGCDIGTAAEGNGGKTRVDGLGNKFAAHWVVKPGREVNHTNVNAMMNLEDDSTLHFIAAHLHPYAESFELFDLTDGKSVFKVEPKLPADRPGLEHVEYFRSAQGLPIYKDHQYELISVYNNPTDKDSDAMASMFLYIVDKRFHRPLAHRL